VETNLGFFNRKCLIINDSKGDLWGAIAMELRGIGSLLKNRLVSGPGDAGFRECSFFKIPRARFDILPQE